ncbi:hypothetical protein ACOSQ4_019501 [Xanthoceras sorbifolium]
MSLLILLNSSTLKWPTRLVPLIPNGNAKDGNCRSKWTIVKGNWGDVVLLEGYKALVPTFFSNTFSIVPHPPKSFINKSPIIMSLQVKLPQPKDCQAKAALITPSLSAQMKSLMIAQLKLFIPPLPRLPSMPDFHVLSSLDQLSNLVTQPEAWKLESLTTAKKKVKALTSPFSNHSQMLENFFAIWPEKRYSKVTIQSLEDVTVRGINHAISVITMFHELLWFLRVKGYLGERTQLQGQMLEQDNTLEVYVKRLEKLNSFHADFKQKLAKTI